MGVFHAVSGRFTAKRLSSTEGRFAFCFDGRLARSVAALALLVLASCTPVGKPVTGVAESRQWFSLPFDEFLHDGDAAPEAMSFCAVPECPARLAVGVLAVTGNSARQLERILHRPDLLTAELDDRARKPTLKRTAARGSARHIATALAVTPLRFDPATGFSLTMNRKDGKGRIESAVLGWRDGETLHVVIAIGDNGTAAREAATHAVARYGGPTMP